jgi:hypothetical protein
LEFRFREIRHIQTAHDRWRRAESATRRRARDAEVRGDGHVAGAVDQMPKPVVVALLQASRGRHEGDHRRFPHAAQLLKDDGDSAGVTTTRAGKCRMSMGTAQLSTNGANPPQADRALCAARTGPADESRPSGNDPFRG